MEMKNELLEDSDSDSRGGGRGGTRTPVTREDNIWHSFSNLMDEYWESGSSYEVKIKGLIAKPWYKEIVDSRSYYQQKLDDGDGDLEEQKKLLKKCKEDLQAMEIRYDSCFNVPMEKVQKMRKDLANKLQGVKLIDMEETSGYNLEDLLKEFQEFRPTKVKYSKTYAKGEEKLIEVCTKYKIESERIGSFMSQEPEDVYQRDVGHYMQNLG